MSFPLRYLSKTSLNDFWQAEEPALALVMFTEEGKCESFYLSERIREKIGRFLVPLPFMDANKLECFPESRQPVLSRFQNLGRKLQSNPALNQVYLTFE